MGSISLLASLNFFQNEFQHRRRDSLHEFFNDSNAMILLLQENSLANQSTGKCVTVLIKEDIGTVSLQSYRFLEKGMFSVQATGRFFS